MRWLALAAIGCTPISDGPTMLIKHVRFHLVADEPGSVANSFELKLFDETGAPGSPLMTPPSSAVIDLEPDWSSDGKWIVFASSRERKDQLSTSIWIVSAVGDKAATPRRLTDDGGVDVHPTFAPGNGRIVFSSTRAGGSHLFTMDVDGGTPLQLTHESGEVEPTWSHDGKRIVFTSVHADGMAHVAIMSSTGGDAVELGDGRTPVFTPDDKQIVYANDSGTDLDLWEMNADGTNARDLLPNTIGDETEPKLSSDGRWVFASANVKDRDDKTRNYRVVVLADLSAPSLKFHVLGLAGQKPPWRISIAVAPGALDSRALGATPTYEAAIGELVH
jgi:Tol biopolymer transport system component